MRLLSDNLAVLTTQPRILIFFSEVSRKAAKPQRNEGRFFSVSLRLGAFAWDMFFSDGGILRMGNWAKTTLLLGLMTALIVFIGGLFGGRQGMVVAFVLAMAMNFFSYWYSDKIVLRMYRATEVNPHDFPTLFHAVNRLAQNAGLPKPHGCV